MHIKNHGVKTGAPEWTTLTPLIHVHLNHSVNTGGTCIYSGILNVHVSVVLILFILEHLCLHRDFKCTCTSGVSVAHSGAPVFTLNFKCTCISGVSVIHSGAPVFTP
jgi:hypothetical protein